MAQPFSQVSHNRRFATAVFCDTTDRSSKGATSANGMVRPCSCPTSDRMLGWGAKPGARHISATDLTQYLLADLIVRVENTGFSYASPGPLGSRLNRLAFPAWNSSLQGGS